MVRLAIVTQATQAVPSQLRLALALTEHIALPLGPVLTAENIDVLQLI